MDLADFDKEKYSQAAYSMLKGDLIIMVEGGANKLFYKEFEEINHIPILVPFDVVNGEYSEFSSSDSKKIVASNSCSTIKRLIEKNESFYGIIDGDFMNYKLCNSHLFVLNYYSLENIVLLKHSKFDGIRNDLIRLLNGIELSKYRMSSYTLNINPNEGNASYNIQVKANLNEQYCKDIAEKVIDVEDYLQYMPVKDLIRRYDQYLRHLSKEHKKHQYFGELYEELKDKNLLNLFSSSQHNDIRAICK